MYDPISQAEYYQVRAIFEPHQVRTDRVRGELDRAKNGLVRVYDKTNAITHFLLRGDERRPDTNRVMSPGVLHALGGRFEPEALRLPRSAASSGRGPHLTHLMCCPGWVALGGAAPFEKRLAEVRNGIGHQL